MKKFYNLALIFIALFSSVIFSACGNKYQNIGMTIEVNGKVTDHIELIIDENSIEKSSAEIGIEFSGIDANDIGQVLVSSVAEELIDTRGQYRFDGNKCYVTIDAINVGKGELVAYHYASGKSVSIDLEVKQKSNNIRINDFSKYIVSIPNENTNTHYLNTKDILTVFPYNSSDEVVFKLADGEYLSENLTILDEEGCVVGFKIPSSMDSAEIRLYPITKLEGYENTEYVDKTFTVAFCKILNENNFYLESQDPNYDITKVSHLIANDNAYSSMQVNIKYRESINVAELYNIETSTTNKSINRVVDDNKVFVEASSYTENEEIVTVSLVPKNFVGDIKTVSKSFKVKGDVKSTKISVYKDGSLKELSDNDLNNKIDLYDGYANGQGTLFRFNPSYNNIPVFKGLRNIKISIDGSILKSNFTGTGTLKYVLSIKNADGTNIEFTPKTSSTIYEAELECGENGVEIYVSLVLGSGEKEAANLDFDITTINDSGLNYLSGIESSFVKLKFDSKEGVTQVQSGAVWYGKDVALGYHGLSDRVTDIYLDRTKGVDVASQNTESSDNAYKFILPNEILGYSNQLITDINMKVEVKANFENCINPVKLLQIQSSVIDIDLLSANKSINYTYKQGQDEQSKINNLILLVFDKDTDLGDYTIIFKQEGSGFESDLTKGSINVKVYQGFTTDDIDVVVDANEMIENFYNNENGQRDAFADYDADYIIASNQEASISINLAESVLKSNIVKGYNFGTYEVSNGNKVEDYFYTLTNDDLNENNAKFSFIKGTYIGDKQYISLKVKVKINNYTDFVTSAGFTYVEKDLTFYIYDKVSYSNMSLHVDNPSAYMQELLGIYDKDKAVANVSIKMKDNNNALWNYVTENNGKLVTWSFENADTVGKSTLYDGKTEKLTFKQQNEEYIVVVNAVVWQFGTPYTFTREILVKKPTITENVRVESDVKYLPNGNMQIDLKQNDEYELKVTNLSSKGIVDSQDVILRIVNNNYTTLQDAITIEDNVLKVNKVVGNLKLIVFAKDALELDVLGTLAGYDDPSSFLMEGHKQAYLMINLQLSDGKTEDTAYSIYNADDLIKIKNEMVVDENSDGTLDNIYYRVMNDINLSSITKSIDNFAGTLLTTYEMVDGGSEKVYNNFNLYSLTLGTKLNNLFDNFHGRMSNITFSVDYDYNIDKNNNVNYLGVIGYNAGVLENVCARVSGDADISGNNIAYFGGLVGKNEGTIEYTDSLMGVYGEITLKGNKQIYFGGLVGVNCGNIKGFMSSNNVGSGISFVVSIEQEGYTSNITINGTALSNENSAIGGLVGFNSYNDAKIGTITDVKVSGTINGFKNVGGVIGENNLVGKHKATLSLNASGYIETVIDVNYYIVNAISSVILSGQENVGGVVGLDNAGTYKDCKYQIKPSISNTEKTYSILGSYNVGGIAGQSTYGKFKYCSVMSYWWDYANLDTTFSGKSADIIGSDYVGGVVGKAVNSNSVFGDGIDVTENVAIVYSSVNAFIKGAEDKNIGGILSVGTGTSIVANAYFMGKLEGDVYSFNNICIVNEGTNNLVYNIVYSVTNLGVGSFKDSGTIDLKTTNGKWRYDASLNGGYIYIVNDDNNPIFEVAPTSVSATIKAAHTINNKVLYLEYYDFNSSIKDKQVLNSMHDNHNILNLQDLFEFAYEPTSLGYVQLRVVSSDVTKLKVNIDGTITISGVGHCTLEFVSALNPGVSTGKIDVYISYPLGDVFRIVDGGGFDSTNFNANDNIANGSSKRYFVETSGNKPYVSQGSTPVYYVYITNSNPSLELNVNPYNIYINEIDDYLSVNGIPSTNGVYKLSSVSQFSLSILQFKEGLTFDISVTPYIEFEIDGTPYSKDYSNVQEFKLGMKNGATDISLNYNYAVLYPNDETTLKVTLFTDKELDGSANNNIFDFISKMTQTTDTNGTSTTEDITSASERKSFFEKIVYGKLENNKQVVELTLQVDKTISYKKVIDIRFALNNGKTAFVRYTILPQKIADINVKNYTLKDEDKDGDKEIDELKFVLKPSTANSSNGGMMEINMVPDNGYFEYLEIKDITGDEEIKFVQVKGYDGETVVSNPIVTTDGKGIKLVKGYNEYDGTIFVYTQIDADYSSKPHTVEISAYLNNGQFLYAQTYNIEVRMLPSVTINQLLPNGKVGVSVTDLDNTDDNYIALNVDTEIRVDIKNVTEPVEVTLEKGDGVSGTYSVVNSYGNFWTIKGAGNSADLGKTITLKVKALSVADNGDTDETTASIQFKIVNYVVHGVSVNNSHNNVDNPDIYGNFNNPIELEFYFNSTDISFEGNKNHDKVYKKDDLYDTTNDTLNSIYQILEDLNNNSSDFLKLNKGIDSTGNYLSFNNDKKVKLVDNNLIVFNNYNDDGPVYLGVDFDLDISQTNNIDDFKGWLIKESGTSDCEDNVKINYELNFNEASSMIEPQLVRNAQEFNDMAEGENYYILGQDIELDSYIPLDKNIKEFDGNGHTITIRSFDYSGFEEVDLKAGLFKQIHEGMVVKNLKVKYVSTQQDGIGYSFGMVNSRIKTFADICSNKEISYNSAQFGGIAAINNGIITNCQVEGQVALRASTVEEKVAENVGIFKIGGLVATNSKTGYITNSGTTLNIYSQANIGGFVYENQGKISSSGVNDIKIDSYNANLGNRVVVDIAGFAVTNSGFITMSYVEFLTNTISAHDSGAGFVYNNKGNITDCYMEMTTTGDNSNEFSGFVHQNSGYVATSYSFFNKGVLGETNYHFFAPNATAGIVDCFEIVDISKNDGYENSGVSNLFTIDYDDKNLRSSYESKGFAFGDNESAVWKYVAGKTPRLISTLEKVEHVKNSGTATYYGLQNIVETKTYENGVLVTKVVVNSSTYGTKNNPYIIHNLDTWNYYFTNNTTKYYRIVADIDFKTTTPSTSKFTFSGNIQGNKMTISNYMLNSNESLNTIGLFDKLVYVNDVNIVNAVRNLHLDTYSIWASKTMAVGLLAGSLENFNIYNIGLSSKNIVVGGNAVGGLVGIAYGQFDIQKIDSNVSVNSSRVTQNRYPIYLSQENNNGYNLESVYYAGSVVGILDGYLNSAFDKEDRYNYLVNDRIENYCNVRTISVNGNIDILGDYVGGAFGFVGERVYVKDVKVNLEDSNLAGAIYSAAVAGENRGVIDNAIVVLANESFKGTDLYDSKVSAGAVGLNIGGLVQNVSVKADIVKSNKDSIVGGIIGRNVNGIINSVGFDGKLMGDFVGAIVATDYVEDNTNNKNFYSISLDDECFLNENLITNGVVKYFNYNGQEIKNYQNLSISIDTIKYLLENINKFYGYKNAKNLNASIIGKKVYGLVAGLTNVSNNIVNYGLNKDKTSFLVNNSNIEVIPEIGTFDVKVEGGRLLPSSAVESNFNIGFVNIIKEANILPNDYKNNVFVTYIIGSNVTVMDVWSTSVYGKDVLVFGEGLTYEQPIKLLDSNSNELDCLIMIDNTTISEDITKSGEIIQFVDVTQTYSYSLRGVNVDKISLDLSKMIKENDFMITGKVNNGKIEEDVTENNKFIIQGNPETALTIQEIDVTTNTVSVEVKWTEKVEGIPYYYSTTYTFTLI